MDRPLRVYKPNDNGNGAGFQFRYGIKNKDDARRREPVMFIEATRQSGPKPKPGSTQSPFNWEDKTIVMMNTDELGQIVAFISGLDKVKKTDKNPYQRSFYHKHDSGDKRITIEKPEPDNKWQNWKFTISKGKGDFLQVYMTPGEVYQLKLLCEKIIMEFFGRPMIRK